VFYEIYTEHSQYRWRLVAANGKRLANGGEAYHNKSDCLSAINLVKGSANVPVHGA